MRAMNKCGRSLDMGQEYSLNVSFPGEDLQSILERWHTLNVVDVF